MRVLVTGNRGYIGVHLVELLKSAGHQVTGCDVGLFDGCHWEPFVQPDVQLVKDVRRVRRRDLDGHDAICHLAAISNDPMGDLDAALTSSVNRDGSIHLARCAKQAGVGRFLFSGSCSVYGQGTRLDLVESDPLNPITAYAKSKIETERLVGQLADDGFTPVFLRNATAYGDSPMLRIDLVVNNLLASALAYGKIAVKSDGTPWRPLIHCRDIARAFVALLHAPQEAIHNRAINVGGNAENYQVRDVADLVGHFVTDAAVQYTGEAGSDPRDYRVNFDLLGQVLPEFQLQFNLQRGIEQLHRKMRDHRFSAADFEGPKFVRLRTLQKRLLRLNGAA